MIPSAKRNLAIILALLMTLAAAQGQTMIRLAHLSPNIPDIDVRLLQAPSPATTEAAETTEVAPAEPAWQEVAITEGLRYGHISDYQVLAAGSYRVQLVPVGETEAIAERELNLGNGNYYTVSAIGLRLAGMEDVEDVPAGGFMSWLQGLFGGEDPRDPEVLRLRIEAFEDRPSNFAPAGQAHVRLVHAAPGTSAVQLWAMRSGDTISLPNVSYGQVGAYQAVPAGTSQLDVLEMGDTPATLHSAEMDFEVGHLYTVFVVGTEIEAVPFAVVVTTDASLGGGAEADLEGAAAIATQEGEPVEEDAPADEDVSEEEADEEEEEEAN
jgi:hypothetical protein